MLKLRCQIKNLLCQFKIWQILICSEKRIILAEEKLRNLITFQIKKEKLPERKNLIKNILEKIFGGKNLKNISNCKRFFKKVSTSKQYNNHISFSQSSQEYPP